MCVTFGNDKNKYHLIYIVIFVMLAAKTRMVYALLKIIQHVIPQLVAVKND